MLILQLIYVRFSFALIDIFLTHELYVLFLAHIRSFPHQQ
jgi:hypothetical protein